MTRAPEVLYRHRDGLFDDTARAWRAEQVKPLVPADAKERRLHHQTSCVFAEAAELVEVCPCTARQRAYRDRHPGGGAK